MMPESQPKLLPETSSVQILRVAFSDLLPVLGRFERECRRVYSALWGDGEWVLQVAVELTIPYEYLGVSHSYVPDFVVRMVSDVNLLLEIKGDVPDKARAKHQAARRWVSAVNNWGKLGKWDVHACLDPQMLSRELEHLSSATTK